MNNQPECSPLWPLCKFQSRIFIIELYLCLNYMWPHTCHVYKLIKYIYIYIYIQIYMHTGVPIHVV